MLGSQTAKNEKAQVLGNRDRCGLSARVYRRVSARQARSGAYRILRHERNRVMVCRRRGDRDRHDNGAGLGASHQTGWTGLVAKLLEQSGE